MKKFIVDWVMRDKYEVVAENENQAMDIVRRLNADRTFAPIADGVEYLEGYDTFDYVGEVQ